MYIQNVSLPDKTFKERIQTVNAVPTSGTLSYLARMQTTIPATYCAAAC